MRGLVTIICIFSLGSTFSQEIDVPLDQNIEPLIIVADSIPNDSTDNLGARQRGDITTTINYDAKDSLYFEVKSQKFYLYGDTHIDYGKIQLDAERTDVDWGSRTIKSYYVTDTTGKKIGKPVFTDGPEMYVTDDILYNFKSKRALIKGVVTEQQGGYMHGEDVRKNEDNEMFILKASYTTCNLEDPHFSIESSRLKVIPNKKVVSGPFHMKFRDLPTPLFFPFGMFPQPKEKTSGIIVPSYGEEQLRGFFLRDGGYYFAISDYVDLRITGDIYSKGASAVSTTSNYVKRYAYRGAVNLSYNKLLLGDPEDAQVQNDFWIRWNHTPQTRGSSSISASVSAGTQSYSQNNNLVNQDIERSINSQFTSNVSYSKRFQGTPFNMSTNLRHNQNVATGIMNLTLPDFTLNMSRIYPFQNIVKSSKSPLAKLSFSHNFVAKNEISNQAISYGGFNFEVANAGERDGEILDFNSENLEAILDRSRVGGKHTVPISTSMNVLKFFTLNPNFNYTDLWYTKELDYTYLASENAVRIDTLDGFSRAGSWSSGASLNTRIYGTRFFSKGKLQAIRHVMTPSLSFSYNPDFSDTKYGVYKEVQIDSAGTMETYSKYQGFAYGSPQGRESKTIGFSLSNNIEMKVASKKDTVNGFKKVKVFDNLGLSSGYNLAAESFKLNPMSINARTSFFDSKISVNFTGTIDPYIYQLNSESINSSGERTVSQVRLDKYAWNNGQGLGQLSRANTTIGLNLSPKRKNNQANQRAEDSFTNGIAPPGEGAGFDGYTDEEREVLAAVQNNPDFYVDFNVPWTLRMNYSINRTKQGFQDAAITQSLSFNGSLGLTEKTQITFNSGYDFENKDFTTTRVGVSRDLHCWAMRFDWVPFGRFQSYFLSIRVKASVLQDLKLEKRRSFSDFFN